MITSGLVITLSPDAALAAQAIAKVSARPEFMPGARNDRWLPVAMEAHDDAESRDLHDWLHALPGVAYVDVVSVNFEDAELSPATSDGQSPSEPDSVLSESEIFSMNRFQHRGSEDTEKDDLPNLCALQNSALNCPEPSLSSSPGSRSKLTAELSVNTQLASDRANQVNHEH